MSGLPVISPDLEFDGAARLVLGYLHAHVPLAVWAVTRVENDRQTYLFLDGDDDNAYGLAQGGSHAWEDSFCVHMAAGRAPAVAPDAQSVPQYAAAGVNDGMTIGSYAGAVISEPDGTLFGAICGIDPQVRTDDPALRSAAPLLQLLGQLLTMVLAADRARDAAARAVWTARAEADRDVLTGLHNRRAWERLVGEDSVRFARTGDPTVVVMIDLDRLKAVNDEHGHEAGDEHIRTAASVLRRAVREDDLVARLGGDEFGVLMSGCTERQAQDRTDRLCAALDAAGVAGSLGWAPISVLRGFPAALAEADAAMYAAKRARRSRDRPAPVLRAG